MSASRLGSGGLRGDDLGAHRHRVHGNVLSLTPMSDRRKLRRVIPRPIRHLLYDRSRSRRRRWRRYPGIQRVPPDQGIVLTFDDGPDPRSTEEVLNVLSTLEKKATFFLLGERVLESPDLARELRSRGHEIALHGMVHRRHDVLARGDALRELSSGLDAIETTVQCRPRWYRPPYGRASSELVSVCGELGLSLVYWSAWGHDWEAISASRIARLVLRDCDAGAVVLLHDSALYADRDDAQPTVDAIPLIAEWANDAGLQLTSLGAALDGVAR